MRADLNSLVVFSNIIDAGSFSEAARRLRMPVSSVSRRIAELEDQLGLRLLDRSTRSLRLTEVGSEILVHARRSVEVREAVTGIASNQVGHISGTLSLSAPPSICESLVIPMLREFQAENPDVRIRVTVTDRVVDHIGDGVDLAFHVGPLKNCSLIARRLLTFRRRLVASPCYIQNSPPLEQPRDLMNHRVLTFAHWRPDASWKLRHVSGPDQECVAVISHLEINDFASLTAALLAGVGVGQLPPFVRPDLLSNGMLCEVMPDWHFHPSELWLVHLCNRHVSPAIRSFRAQAGQTVRRLFPNLQA